MTRSAHRVDDECREWLEALITGFQSERGDWDKDEAGLEGYWAACTQLKLQILHLTACAYLHVSYDLPRVIADNWPGADCVVPTEVAGTLCFFDLAPVFDEAFRKAARQYDAIGVFSIFTRFLPIDAVSIASNWVLNLRSTAWSHAFVLHKEPDLRSLREIKMREAMSAALWNVSNLKPWTGLLSSPDMRLHSPASAGLSLALLHNVSMVDIDHILEGAGTTAAIGGLTAALAMQQVRRQGHVLRFVDELGRRTLEYVTRAIADPKSASFEEIGLKPFTD